MRSATFSAMMDNEADHFRRIQLVSDDRAFYRRLIDKCHKRLGHIAERLGEPEEGGTR